MSRLIFNFLWSLPTKILNGLMGAGSVVATLWPDWCRRTLGHIVSIAQVRGVGIIMFLLVAVYLGALWFLRPSKDEGMTKIPLREAAAAVAAGVKDLRHFRWQIENEFTHEPTLGGIAGQMTAYSPAYDRSGNIVTDAYKIDALDDLFFDRDQIDAIIKEMRRRHPDPVDGTAFHIDGVGTLEIKDSSARNANVGFAIYNTGKATLNRTDVTLRKPDGKRPEKLE